MSAQGNAPIIIKRKKVVAGGGHHGGAWKVAYADFVTAMMAFFMLMWLLGATTENQRKGIADYFTPTIPIVKASGGGGGAFGGDSIFSENTLSKSGTGAAAAAITTAAEDAGATGVQSPNGQPEDATGKSQKPEDLETIEKALLGVGGESMINELLRRHIVTRINDEGLVIELFDTEEARLFDADQVPTKLLGDLLSVIVPILDLVKNDLAIQAHSRAYPVVSRVDPTWDITSARTNQLRFALEEANLEERRVVRMTDHADRLPLTKNPMDQRNNRVEIIVLRKSTR
jgi:chemotaxis protein MotB